MKEEPVVKEEPTVEEPAVVPTDSTSENKKRIYVVIKDENHLSAGELSLFGRLEKADGEVIAVDKNADFDWTSLTTSDRVVVTKDGYNGAKKDLKKELRATRAGVLVCDKNVVKDLGLGSEFENDRFSKMTVVRPDHPMAAGLSGEVEIFDSLINYTYVQSSSGDSDVIGGWYFGNSQKWGYMIYMTYSSGGELADGSLAQGRRSFVPCSDKALGHLTDNGWKLFDAAVDYLNQ